MKRKIKLSVLLAAWMAIYCISATAQDPDAEWQKPPEEVMNVLHAPQLPWIWTAPTGEYLFLAEPSDYPTLAEMSAPMYKLAGIRVNPANNGYHGDHGGKNPYIIRIEDGCWLTVTTRGWCPFRSPPAR